LPTYWPISEHPWLMVKLGFVFFLFLYHLHCGKILKDLKQKNFTYTSNGLRIFNEVATLFLFSIVFLAVLRNVIHMGYGLLGFLILSIILFLGIKLYKKIRAG
jgi:protoporphyrinogen IX oxidase